VIGPERVTARPRRYRGAPWPTRIPRSRSPPSTHDRAPRLHRPPGPDPRRRRLIGPDARFVAGPHRDEAILYGEADLGIIPFAKFFCDAAGSLRAPDVFSFGIDGRVQTALSGRRGADSVEGGVETRLLSPPRA
jgi:hypothetical protein